MSHFNPSDSHLRCRVHITNLLHHAESALIIAVHSWHVTTDRLRQASSHKASHFSPVRLSATRHSVSHPITQSTSLPITLSVAQQITNAWHPQIELAPRTPCAHHKRHHSQLPTHNIRCRTSIRRIHISDVACTSQTSCIMQNQRSLLPYTLGMSPQTACARHHHTKHHISARSGSRRHGTRSRTQSLKAHRCPSI